MFTVLPAAGGYTMSETTKVIARIRRLMALGTRNSNPHEAARAVALAQRLMQRHGLTPDMLSLHDIQESVCQNLTSNAEKSASLAKFTRNSGMHGHGLPLLVWLAYSH
ncbi:Protein of uncharacterised function (DUF2786) [Citrobacter koseri]|nr:Protein of uncharacterised function (DUF2786) [Citrobacter koseri]